MPVTPTSPADNRLKNGSGLRRIANAAGCSLAGLRAAWRHEDAFRQEICLALPLVILACLVNVSAAERALLIASVLLVLIVELVNSAIEAAVDRISPEYHALAGRAKDLGSAAVLLGIVNAAAVWIIVLAG